MMAISKQVLALRVMYQPLFWACYSSRTKVGVLLPAAPKRQTLGAEASEKGKGFLMKNPLQGRGEWQTLVPKPIPSGKPEEKPSRPQPNQNRRPCPEFLLPLKLPPFGNVRCRGAGAQASHLASGCCPVSGPDIARATSRATRFHQTHRPEHSPSAQESSPSLP